MIYSTRLEQWSEDMDSAITPLLELLGDQMKHLKINSSTGGGVMCVGIPKLAEFEDKWEGKLNEVAARIEGMAVFSGGG